MPPTVKAENKDLRVKTIATTRSLTDAARAAGATPLEATIAAMNVATAAVKSDIEDKAESVDLDE